MRYYCTKYKEVIPLKKAYKVCLLRGCPHKVLMTFGVREFNKLKKKGELDNEIYKYTQPTTTISKCDSKGLQVHGEYHRCNESNKKPTRISVNKKAL